MVDRLGLVGPEETTFSVEYYKAADCGGAPSELSEFAEGESLYTKLINPLP